MFQMFWKYYMDILVWSYYRLENFFNIKKNI